MPHRVQNGETYSFEIPSLFSPFVNQTQPTTDPKFRHFDRGIFGGLALDLMSGFSFD